MDSNDFIDPYVDPATGILRNLVGAADEAGLAVAEGALVFARGVQMLERRPKPTGDLAELRAIHKQLFQDVYPWAGEIRQVDIVRNSAGSEYFLPQSRIEQGAGFAAEQLRDDDYLKGMTRDEFIARLAHHYDQLNYVHPFREGNGRTQRAFWNRVARDAGWQLDWTAVRGEVNDEACRLAQVNQDLAPLRDVLGQVVSPAVQAAGRDQAWRTVEQRRLG